MKALSLWQPWASAIALGLKQNETRSWATDYRGPLAIHAAGKDTRTLIDIFNGFMTRKDFCEPFWKAGFHTFGQLPKSAIVAIADLYDVVPTEDFVHRRYCLTPLEIELGDYGINRFVWRLRLITALEEPFPIAGHQRIFEVPDRCFKT